MLKLQLQQQWQQPKKTNGHDDDGRGDRAQAKSGVSKLRKIERVGSMGWGGLLKYNFNG